MSAGLFMVSQLKGHARDKEGPNLTALAVDTPKAARLLSTASLSGRTSLLAGYSGRSFRGTKRKLKIRHGSGGLSRRVFGNERRRAEGGKTRVAIFIRPLSNYLITLRGMIFFALFGKPRS